MGEVHQFPQRKPAEAEETAHPLEFFTHPPRYPTVQSVAGSVVGQVVVLPSSPDQSRKLIEQTKSGDGEQS